MIVNYLFISLMSVLQKQKFLLKKSLKKREDIFIMTYKYEPICHCDYGPLDPKVDLKPDFFTGFEAKRRKEITNKEESFYHSITAPFSVDDQLEKRYFNIPSNDQYLIKVKEYRPKNNDLSLPAVMFFHGGGFVTCTIETHDYVPSYIAAKANVVCFSVEYRLAPEAKFPTGLEDSYTACKFIMTHAKEFNINTERFSVMGDSSGGNYAAVLCHMARDRKDLKFHKQVLIYPVTDIGNLIAKKSVKIYGGAESISNEPAWYLKCYLNNVKANERNPYVSPMWADSFINLPPALLIGAECDSLLDDGLIYANLLAQDNVPVEYHIYKGMPHAFILRTYPETFEALDTIATFLE